MEEKKTELKMIKMSEVQSQEIEWLWYPFIPYGKLTIVQGDPGDGKTTLILNIAAKLSKGEGLDNDMKLMESMNIIYQTAEDGLADTVKPRLEKAGADCERILIIDESDKSLSMADERLEEAIIQTGARMLILDPIQAYLGGGMDMNRANEARDMTKRLGVLAEKYKCAIILIGHMNKASGNKAAYRGMGSIDFFAVARSVLLVGRVEGEPNIRAVVQYVFPIPKWRVSDSSFVHCSLGHIVRACHPNFSSGCHNPSAFVFFAGKVCVLRQSGSRSMCGKRQNHLLSR